MAREVAMEPPASAGGSSPGSVLQCHATLCTPSRHAAGREEIERFEAAFDQLPADAREAIAMRRIVGLEYNEVAKALCKSEGAVRNLVYRGLARLSAVLVATPGSGPAPG